LFNVIEKGRGAWGGVMIFLKFLVQGGVGLRFFSFPLSILLALKQGLISILKFLMFGLFD
jgi:hypothetical protein